MNTLTGAGILAEDKLFATLDPTTRVLELKDGQQILLTDTVGFIRKLPHHLVEAFKSTLEEAKYADYIIHVVDASNPQAELQMHTVYETLRELGATGKKIITLLNKQDQVQEKRFGIFGRIIQSNVLPVPERAWRNLKMFWQNSSQRARFIWKNYILTKRLVRFRSSGSTGVCFQKNIGKMEFL